MKKKNLVLLGATAMLSLALAGSLGAVNVASAESINQDSGKNTSEMTVNYSAPTQWTVEIPQSITIGGGAATINVSNAKLEEGKNLKITVASTNGWKVKGDGEGNGFTYQLKKGEDPVTDEVLTVAAGTETGSAELTAELNDENASKYATSGEGYTDTLTFTVTVA